MSRAARLWMIGSAVVALILTVLGLVVAATDHTDVDTLRLHGQPPETAAFHLHVLSSGTSIDGDCALSFTRDSGTCALGATGTTLSLRWVGGVAYLSNAAQNGQWLGLATGQPDLFGLSLEMVKPDIALLAQASPMTVSHQGWRTLHTFVLQSGSLRANGGPATLVITTGTEGQVESASLSGMATGGQNVELSITITSYNQPVVVSAPPRSQVHVAGPSDIAGLFQLVPGLSGALGGSGIGV